MDELQSKVDEYLESLKEDIVFDNAGSDFYDAFGIHPVRYGETLMPDNGEYERLLHHYLDAKLKETDEIATFPESFLSLEAMRRCLYHK